MKIRRQFIFALWFFLFFIGVALFFWTFRSVPFDKIVDVLAALNFWKILILLVLNIAILLIAPLRWWLILRAQGNRLPYFPLAGYRQAASAVSYFTPGQNFGGEPVQILALRNRHKLSGSAALTSVGLDRAIELIGNLVVLILGSGFVLTTGRLAGIELRNALAGAVFILMILIGYLVLLLFGLRPMGRLLKNFEGRFFTGLRSAEEQLGDLIRRKPTLFLEGLAISALIWVGLFFEFWLALDFLGLRMDLSQLILVVTAGRVALLAPTPGALGALEASQMLAIQALGFDPAYGLGLALLIRGRDVLFAVVGLILGGLGLR